MAFRVAPQAPTQRAALRGVALRGAALRHAAPAARTARVSVAPRAELLPLKPRTNPLLSARGADGTPLSVLDTEGRSIPFATLTAGKTVVSFIRHFVRRPCWRAHGPNGADLHRPTQG
jgi:hypothetical protein